MTSHDTTLWWNITEVHFVEPKSPYRVQYILKSSCDYHLIIRYIVKLHIPPIRDDEYTWDGTSGMTSHDATLWYDVTGANFVKPKYTYRVQYVPKSSCDNHLTSQTAHTSHEGWQITHQMTQVGVGNPVVLRHTGVTNFAHAFLCMLYIYIYILSVTTRDDTIHMRLHKWSWQPWYEVIWVRLSSQSPHIVQYQFCDVTPGVINFAHAISCIYTHCRNQGWQNSWLCHAGVPRHQIHRQL